MYSPEQIFVWNVDGLREATKNPTILNLFSASGKLRLLLMDEHPLIHQVNRKLRMKLRFEVITYPDISEFMDLPIFLHFSPISPNRAWPHTERKSLSLDHFLKCQIMQMDGKRLTVGDVIKYVANYAGAVHKGPPDTPETQALETASGLLLAEFPMVLYAMRDIAEVGLTGCIPLYLRLRSDGPG